MEQQIRTWLPLLLALAGSPAASAAVVELSLSAPTTRIEVGQRFSIDILADIPDPVSGWGLDLGLDAAILQLVGTPAIGSAWTALAAADGDGLAGLAPFPGSVSGSDILLARLELEAIGPGLAALMLSVTPGDLSEGLPLGFPAAPGSFAELSFSDLTVEVAAAPAAPTLLLLGGGLALLRLRRRRAGPIPPRPAHSPSPTDNGSTPSRAPDSGRLRSAHPRVATSQPTGVG